MEATRNCLEGELSMEDVKENVNLVVDSTLPLENAEVSFISEITVFSYQELE